MAPRRASFALLVALLATVLLAPPAQASRHLLLGLMDDANTLNAPATTFPLLGELHVQVTRMTLTWSGVARRKPAHPRDPADPAYSWGRYDAAVQAAEAQGIRVLLTIYGTPRWANGGQPPNRAPRSSAALRDFAYAAAKHFPDVRLWLAWNEPNNPVFLTPQYRKIRGRWVAVSPAAYARICTAVYQGVHAAGGGEKVGCGATAPRGSNNPGGYRPSIAPLSFLQLVKRAGLRRFDAWAHHPYSGSRAETPSSRPRGGGTVELGNIGSLVSQLTRLYGAKRVWITEYGWQTRPPDPFFGVTLKQQASYLRQAYLIAKRNPRIDLFTWYLLRDEPNVGGWQSGLITASGKRKPAFAAFRRLRG
ncbi:MAG TPA: hypothetical protein VFK17_06415 [Gaiellaceae bacterium]|nr:hypothetical protein [Gaiellaceae bacterium]